MLHNITACEIRFIQGVKRKIQEDQSKGCVYRQIESWSRLEHNIDSRDEDKEGRGGDKKYFRKKVQVW